VTRRGITEAGNELSDKAGILAMKKAWGSWRRSGKVERSGAD